MIASMPVLLDDELKSRHKKNEGRHIGFSVANAISFGLRGAKGNRLLDIAWLNGRLNCLVALLRPHNIKDKNQMTDFFTPLAVNSVGMALNLYIALKMLYAQVRDYTYLYIYDEQISIYTSFLCAGDVKPRVFFFDYEWRCSGTITMSANANLQC